MSLPDFANSAIMALKHHWGLILHAYDDLHFLTGAHLKHCRNYNSASAKFRLIFFRNGQQPVEDSLDFSELLRRY